MIERLIPAGSTYASDIDFVINLIAVVVGFWFILTLGMFFWLLWRYRYQPGVPTTYVTGKEKHLKRWINIPHMLIIACDVVVIVAAMQVWYTVKQDLPGPDATIRGHAQQWAWSFQHPGQDGQIDTEDDIHTVDELHIEPGKVYHVKLTSEDVLHSFSVPIFRLKQDVIPGREITGWFEATTTGLYDIQCTEMCGIGHGIMGAQLHIETPDQHAAWIARNTQ